MSRKSRNYREDHEGPTRLSWQQKLVRDVGLGLLALLALAASSANISYSPNDPSFNTASGSEVSNWLGGTGAAFADITQQFFGLASIPIAVFIGGVSIFALMRGPNRIVRGKLRFWLGVGGLFLLCLALAALPPSSKWPMEIGFGGLFGDFGLGALTIAFKHAAWAKALFGFLAGLGSLVCCYFAFSLKPNDLYAAFDSAQYYWAGIRVYFDDLFNKQKNSPELARKKPTKKSPNSDEYETEQKFTQRNLASNGIAVDIPKRGKESTRALKEAQPSLPLISGDFFQLPRLEYLTKPKQRNFTHDEAALKQNAHLLMSVLTQYKVQGEIINVRPGPVVTLYELEPEAGIKGARVINLADDIARSMAAISCRVAVVKGRNAIGIELPNTRRESVFLRTLLASSEYDSRDISLPLALGETIGGEPTIADLAKMPHLLIAGTTGSGKSVGINAMILSLLYRLTPDQCRFIMIDPKMLELSVYDGIPHLLAPVVTDPKQAVSALKWTVREMENRYRLMSKIGVRNIAGYNERAKEAARKGETFPITERVGWDKDTGQPIVETRNIELKPMPFIVVVIDEMADLMLVAGKEIEGAVQRLAQMARAAGIHLIMATQRPSVDVITGTIKANFPTRISYMVTSKIDSRTILGESGAEQLLGQGDLLFMAGGGRISRHHGPFVADEEVRQIVASLKAQGEPDYYEDITAVSDDDDGGSSFNVNSGDELFDRAVEIVARDRKVSTSYLQRQLKLGYNRAADLVDRMEREGMISAADHVGKRQILLPQH
jgi:S-DNA-T family DNA segregation ATPase FtsK/SpoIIIE